MKRESLKIFENRVLKKGSEPKRGEEKSFMTCNPHQISFG
jgi:hypothetical protein